MNKERSAAGRRRSWLATSGLILLACLAQPVWAGEQSTLKLRDGTEITGEILTASGGVYTVYSTTLGTIHVTMSDVRTIEYPYRSDALSPPDPPPVKAPKGQLDSMQERMASDPDTMREITALQDTPEMKELLEDPAVIEALKSGNIQALLSNPKLARLAADPRIQRLTDKYSQ